MPDRPRHLYGIRRSFLLTLQARLYRNVLSQRWSRRMAVLALLLLAVEVVGSRPLPPVPPLPLRSVSIRGHAFRVEVAGTDRERARGLMYRRVLPAGHGMLFVFAAPARVYFWMKNTLIPLDILYFDNQRRLVQILANTPPCHADPCPVYPSRADVRYVVELNAGTAQKAGFAPGDRLVFH